MTFHEVAKQVNHLLEITAVAAAARAYYLGDAQSAIFFMLIAIWVGRGAVVRYHARVMKGCGDV